MLPYEKPHHHLHLVGKRHGAPLKQVTISLPYHTDVRRAGAGTGVPCFPTLSPWDLATANFLRALYFMFFLSDVGKNFQKRTLVPQKLPKGIFQHISQKSWFTGSCFEQTELHLSNFLIHSPRGTTLGHACISVGTTLTTMPAKLWLWGRKP